jgi:hypothetical protein
MMRFVFSYLIVLIGLTPDAGQCWSWNIELMISLHKENHVPRTFTMLME